MHIQKIMEGWKLRECPLEWDEGYILRVMGAEDGWLSADYPRDVHSVLLREGVIKDPILKKNYEEIEWIEQRSWWYTVTFDAPKVSLEQFDRLVLKMDGLDYGASIFLNNVLIRRHNSAFYPFEMNVAKMIKQTGNTLTVRLTTGLDRVKDADLGALAESVPVVHENRDDARRLLLRKPQYVFGWDWSPRAASCGIFGDIELVCRHSHIIRHISAHTACITDSGAHVRVTAEVENLHPFATLDGLVTLSISLDGEEAASFKREKLLLSGVNYIDFDARITNPALWWPNGMGEQPLYDIRVTAEAEGYSDSKSITTGIRVIELDERMLRFSVNGIPIFCKGANWIPADTLYGRITDERYTVLVREARNANFNMLRVWGGGLYERDAFYNACDANGILVWQDFMFSCGLYPEDREWFNRDVEKELDFQTRRLSSRACMALWCGNNENAWSFDNWYPDMRHESRYSGAYFYNTLAPEYVRKNSPNIPYWNSSPYGGKAANDRNTGDIHHWFEFFMNPDMERRITPEDFDKLDACFVSEYGYLGPCSHTEIQRYFDGEPIVMGGKIWAAHTNRNDKIPTVIEGIRKQYKDIPDGDLHQFLLYGGLCQGLMYGYSLEALRFKPMCSGALFWMYNDAWGETGWTVIDYSLIRKTAYYFVKRAFAPVKLIIREQCGEVVVTGINETAEDKAFNLRYGVVSLDGSDKREDVKRITIPARWRGTALVFKTPYYNPSRAVVFAASDDSGIQPAVLRGTETRHMELPEPHITTHTERVGDDLRITLNSSGFVHAVHFPDAGEREQFSDLWFDMLPGETKCITWYNAPRTDNELSIGCIR